MAEAKNQPTSLVGNRYNLSLFIFRRDLRLVDNTALISALSQSTKVIAAFIFDPRQIEAHSYLSKPALQFMLNSLLELQSEIKKQKGELYFLHGTPEDVIPKLVAKLDIDAIFFNRDYTPFSKNRDEAIGKICEKNQVKLHIFDDAVLQKPEAVLKMDGKPYTIFTPYCKKARTLHVATPQSNSYQNYYTGSDVESETIKEEWWPHLEDLSLQGGRKEGIRLLNAVNDLSNYSENRNYPAKNETSHLSAHIKFGTVSIRECYYHICATFSPEHTLINELYWHDFFTQIGHYFPHVFSKAFQEKYQGIRWENNKANFKRWCEGNTGFPIVDAGMRELNQTGYMHNRVRMIVASFLTKDLLISWRWGEVYFARQLIDYDPCVNNGNWQWAASTGCDAQPYFRIFNPWLQQEKFDADCLYIKKWIPELADLPPKTIHRLFSLEKSPVSNYPAPMLDHKSAAQKAIQLYKNLS